MLFPFDWKFTENSVYAIININLAYVEDGVLSVDCILIYQSQQTPKFLQTPTAQPCSRPYDTGVTFDWTEKYVYNEKRGKHKGYKISILFFMS